MATELESKISITNMAALNQKIIDLGGKWQSETILQDILYKHHEKKTLNTGATLRVRQYIVDQKIIDAEICYKGKIQSENTFKCREELETKIDKPDMIIAILEALGYYNTFTYQKRRTIFFLDQNTICLDTLPYLGDFIEIEATTEQEITSLLSQLSLDPNDHISKGYPTLLKEKVATLFPDDPPQKVFLDNSY
jgi:predicted adenylyl cyclase CyaB